MRLTDKFILFGARVFSPGTWHRVAFQPLLYLILWGAALRIVITDNVPIPFAEELSRVAEHAWAVLSLICPPLALLAWWLMMRSTAAGAALAGLRIRLAADFGQFVAILVYHLATVFHAGAIGLSETNLYARYIVVASMLFVAGLVVRDISGDRVDEQNRKEARPD